MEKIIALPLQTTDQWGLTSIGYDLKITHPKASLQDYLETLDNFAIANLAPCLGCDGCCHERAPLTVWDIYALSSLLPQSAYPCHQVVKAFALVKTAAEGWTDISLNRTGGNCIFLEADLKKCTNHPKRPFVCRSHYCIPQSPLALGLRTQIVNKGEDLLVAQLLKEAEDGAEGILPPYIKKTDYPKPQNEQIFAAYGDILLKDICQDDLWQALNA